MTLVCQSVAQMNALSACFVFFFILWQFKVWFAMVLWCASTLVSDSTLNMCHNSSFPYYRFIIHSHTDIRYCCVGCSCTFCNFHCFFFVNSGVDWCHFCTLISDVSPHTRRTCLHVLSHTSRCWPCLHVTAIDCSPLNIIFVSCILLHHISKRLLWRFCAHFLSSKIQVTCLACVFYPWVYCFCKRVNDVFPPD
jgi:hypothetical protein